MKVDIVIVNWNSGTLVRDCVQSILDGEVSESIGNIIIVDNNSNDDSISLLPSNEAITLIRNATNLGFAKACNQGFLVSREPYVLLLNPDTLLYSDTLKACIEYMEMHPQTGIMGCQLLNEKGHVTPSCARFPRAIDFFIHGTGLSKLFPRIFRPATLMTDWNHRESREVDQVMGAFMFMRKSVFEQIGYFDERFFVYFEELDFSLRYKRSGGIIYYHADIKAIHQGMGTTSKVKAFRLFLNLRSRLKYAAKNFSVPGLILVYISTFTIEIITRFLLLVGKGRFAEVKDLFLGYGMLILRKST